MKFETLDAWLHHIEGLHAQAIDLGLDRMETMLKRLDIRFKCPVFTVGGTNGKGSTCAFIESALLAGGYSVGVHTSPHLIRFNERVRINGEDAKDEELIRQFEKVEAARGEMTLSYFEYTLLGILLLFAEKDLDAVVLKSGSADVLTLSTRLSLPSPSLQASELTIRLISELPVNPLAGKRLTFTVRANRLSALMLILRLRLSSTPIKSVPNSWLSERPSGLSTITAIRPGISLGQGASSGICRCRRCPANIS